ncbi:MAG: hypothetical protein IPK19_16385 [Chloroflexi bacterium]|nr:hypothetical protein [Chloroflexota bacterium]
MKLADLLRGNRIAVAAATVILAAVLACALGISIQPLHAAGLIVVETTTESLTDDACSFSEAIYAANNNTAYGGCASGSGGGQDIITFDIDEIALLSPFPITDGLLIMGDGQGVTKLARAGAGMAFYVENDVKLELEKLDLVGGIQVNVGEVRLDQVDMRSNTWCLYLFDGLSEVVDSRFALNMSNPVVGILDGASLTIDNALFSDNGYTVIQNIGGTVEITGSTFQYNGAVQNAPIYNTSGGDPFSGLIPGTLTITGSSFTNNHGATAGAVHNHYGTATISGSTFEANSGSSGGAIVNSFDSNAILNLHNSALGLNTATGSGGAVYNAGLATITQSVFTGNEALTSGGAIFTRSDAFGRAMIIRDSIFTANEAIDGGAIAAGGASTGVPNIGSNALFIQRTTFTGNPASNQGGAIYGLPWLPATMSVSNATFAGNGAVVSGGAISHRYGGEGSLGSLTLNNSTFSGNSAPLGSNLDLNVDFTARNTIAADGAGSTNCRITQQGTYVILNSLSTDTSCPSFSNVTGAQLKLGVLGDYGGPTLAISMQTIPLLQGSVAIDAGHIPTCVDAATVNNLDQRGFIRPADGDNNGTFVCDIGVFEADPPAQTATPTSTSTATSTPTSTPTVTASATSTATPTPTASATSTPEPGTVILAIIPDMVVGANSEFELTLEVRAGAQTVSEIDGYVVFLADAMEVVSITPISSPLGGVTASSFDNTAGVIHFASQAAGDPYPSGTFQIALVQMRSKALTGVATNIGFDVLGGPPVSAVYAPGGINVLGGAEDAFIEFKAGAVINGHVTIQGMSAANQWVWHTITPAGGGTVAHALWNYLDHNGTFYLGGNAIEGFPAGVYNIWVKHELSLSSSVANVTLLEGSNDVVIPILRMGDANGDNVINIQDFSLLAAAFGSSNGQAAYNPAVDFNGDSLVNIADFSLLAASFGQVGSLGGP